MPHLLKFRKGWQSEHLAKYILSKFSFIAEPSTVADDLGTDFFCTLFKIETKDKNEFCFPCDSFAIQIKSDSIGRKDIFTSKASYLQNLEIPFFIGIVDKVNLSMKIYSGESIPHFFSTYTDLVMEEKWEAVIKFLEDDEYPNRYHNFIDHDNSKKTCYLEFPRILTINVNYDYSSSPNEIDELFKVCALIKENISSRINNSFLYDLYGRKGVNIYYGSTSKETFRSNFYKKLAEVFCNLLYIYKSNRVDFNFDEFKIYENTFKELKHFDLPEYLTVSYSNLIKEIEKI